MEEEIIDEFQIDTNELERQAIDIIENNLSNKFYDEEQVKRWQNQICEQIMNYLLSVERNYKYVINCCITQKVDAGLVGATSSLIDNDADVCINITWPKDKQKEGTNRFLYCVLNVFALAI